MAIKWLINLLNNTRSIDFHLAHSMDYFKSKSKNYIHITKAVQHY